MNIGVNIIKLLEHMTYIIESTSTVYMKFDNDYLTNPAEIDSNVLLL